MDRRHFLSAAFALAVSPLEWTTELDAETHRAAARFDGLKGPHGIESFPITVQLSRAPGSVVWTGVSEQQARAALAVVIDEILDHGVTGLEYPFHLPPNLDAYVLEYARSRGMFLTYNHTFEKGGVENFNRKAPPPISVYSPAYMDAVRKNLEPVLAEIAQLPRLLNLFCYMDEPFHAGPQSFDFGFDAQREFQKRFGYEMPKTVDAARQSPKEWLDLINFQSDMFPAGWRQVYRLVKAAQPGVKVVLTHDSHSAMGAGVGSDSKLAVDDIFHWGADFADTFVFDIYPYMMFDYRYGDMGKLRKPRFSQLHFAFAQLRNLTRTYDKSMGFWFGTYNRRWFSKFLGPERKAETWAEAEVCFTAVGQGADFLISGYDIPEDAAHWRTLGSALQVLQQAGPGLLRCPKVKARACFVFPRTQYIQLQQEYWNIGVAYDLFRQAFGELDCLHEEQITDATFDGYEVLVMFDIQLLPDAVAKHIAAFVSAGGMLIADAVPSMNAFRQPALVLAETFGVQDAQFAKVTRDGVWVPSLRQPHWFVPSTPGNNEDDVTADLVTSNLWGDDYEFRAVSPRKCSVTTAEILMNGKDAPALIWKKSGKGQSFLFGFSMLDSYFETWNTGDAASRAALVRLLRAITQNAGVTPNIFSSNPEVEACLRADLSDAYIVVINHEAEEPKTHVRLVEPEAGVREVFNITENRRQPFQRTGKIISFEIHVPRERPQLLRLFRES